MIQDRMHTHQSRQPRMLPTTRDAVLCSVAQSCPTLCNPTIVPRQAPLSMILQARLLEWADMTSSRGSFPPRDRTLLS